MFLRAPSLASSNSVACSTPCVCPVHAGGHHHANTHVQVVHMHIVLHHVYGNYIPLEMHGSAWQYS